MGLEAGQECAFTGFTVTYLNQTPCCGHFFTFGPSNHKNEPEGVVVQCMMVVLTEVASEVNMML